MGYFVEHPGGQRFGPADVYVLNQWAVEGRLIPTTVVIDEATGSQFYAQDVPGIVFPGAAGPTMMPGPGAGTPLGTHSSQPIYTPYAGGLQTPLNRQPNRASSAVSASYIASGFGMVMVCCLPPLGALAGVVGIILAVGVRNVDPRGARVAIFVGVLTVALNGLLIALSGTIMNLLKGG